MPLNATRGAFKNIRTPHVGKLLLLEPKCESELSGARDLFNVLMDAAVKSNGAVG